QLYGEMVINKAIANTSEVYQPGRDLEGYSITVKNQNRTARKVYGLDDTGNAERFRDKFHAIVRFSYINKGLYFYDSKVCQYDNRGAVQT
ncbi:DNA primase, partial [Listeria monocytogenes]|nr:DNA primase [Listeria monocytogenes]